MIALMIGIVDWLLSLLTWYLGRCKSSANRYYEGIAQKVAEVEATLKANEVKSNAPDYRNQARMARYIQLQDNAYHKVRKLTKRQEGASRILQKLRDSRGRRIPYLLGVADAILIAVVIQLLGVDRLHVWLAALQQHLV